MVYHFKFRLAARLKSGGPSLGRSPDAHKQRQPVNQDQIQIFGEIGSTQFLEQGESPALFSFGAGRKPCSFFFWSRALALFFFRFQQDSFSFGGKAYSFGARLVLLKQGLRSAPFSRCFENSRSSGHDTAEMPAPANPIQHSFELAAERCEDLTPLVYRRLFREHPEAEAMFRSEGSELGKRSMLSLPMYAILSFAS